MSNQSLLERAYALAESGRFESVRDLRLTLLNEGFTYADLDQLTRPTLAKKLAAKIAKAKNLPAADS